MMMDGRFFAFEVKKIVIAGNKFEVIAVIRLLTSLRTVHSFILHGSSC
jgi:hypothetical protein